MSPPMARCESVVRAPTAARGFTLIEMM
ncbi:type II secretion system protein GspI, partial [Pseudomonas sp. GW460-C8]